MSQNARESTDPTRRLLLSPWLWSVMLLVAAAVWLRVTDDLGFAAYLLMLVGGVLVGVGFVNATFRMPPRAGLLVHLLGAVASGAALAVLASIESASMDGAPRPVVIVVTVVQFAAIPAAGWILIGLLGRIGSAISARDAAKAPVRIGPAWEEERDRAELRFAAIPLDMKALTAVIVGVVVVGGSIVAAVMIATGDLAERLGARIVIIVIGVLVALPAYAIVSAVLRRRTVAATVEISRDRLRVDAGGIRVDLALDEVDELLWRPDSDYARFEVRADRLHLTLNAGLAKVPKSVAPQLPELTRPIRTRLERAGLQRRRGRHGATLYRREAGTVH
ncbi:hypothetical protein ACWGJP_08435 [Microbacterium sp. NPDC055903]